MDRDTIRITALKFALERVEPSSMDHVTAARAIALAAEFEKYIVLGHKS